MIVKNEMANIERCLLAVADHIDCWVIGDTGSTDGTQDFIRAFFDKRGVPGELHEFPFINFEQARNEALQRAYASPLTFDYLLFDDADMELVVEDPKFREQLEAPAYTLLQRAGISYWNTRLVRRDVGARYVGVTHEYVEVPGGGDRRLDGLWYRDHASGSNRVEKFERDIRLLNEALESSPENRRYWFYLAQSLRDAGRTEEAVVAYAKRADMGGWDEEAWYARMQLARCLRRLKDEGGFLREALAAFNQRPWRAEPLYDLAKFYRERGMNDVCALFAEQGLALRLPKPDRDVLFIEDFVYRFGLEEEYSITANYSRDPIRKDRGFAACNWLALKRDVPQDQRSLARRNLRFYAEPIMERLPSYVGRRIDFAAPSGWDAICPSVVRDGLQIVLAQLVVPEATQTAPAGSRLFLQRLSNSLEVETTDEVLISPRGEPPSTIEAVRLFAWRSALWCLAIERAASSAGSRTQTLARIDGGQSDLTLADVRVVESSGAQACWTPLTSSQRQLFIRRYEPLDIRDENANPVPTVAPAILGDTFVAGSQGIEFDGGWLVLVFERLGRPDKNLVLHHRFVWIDSDGALSKVGRPFFFEDKARESVAGLAWHPDEMRLLISYSVRDGETWIATVDADEVRQTLDAADQLPSGAVRTGGERAPAAPPRRPQTVAAPARSDWVPDAPAAGTELMVAGLAERIGPEIERINLQINHPGPNRDDGRPLVVWLHHDVNQVWVKWCNDRSLVDRVSCFVFVSHWQKERFLEAFNLPRERCVVLRNATEVGAATRQWEPGPVWRCAYTSTPFRGLSILLDAWDLLSPTDAELHVWSSMKLYREDDAPFEHLYARAESTPGVVYHGIEPNQELRRALRGMHFLTYPSIFAETSCLAVMEALAAGCRIIVPSLGALPETTQGFARVYPWKQDAEAHAATFADVLADEMARPWKGRPDQSLAQQRYCASECDWGPRLDQWRGLIDALIDHKGVGGAWGGGRRKARAAPDSQLGEEPVATS